MGLTRKRMNGMLIVSLLLISTFIFIPTLFLQRSFASTTIYTVNNEIWINATGISPSAEGEQQFVELKLDVSQQADQNGEIYTSANEGDRGFTPSARQEWLLFKDILRETTNDPTDYFTAKSNMVSYFGFQFVNNTLNCSAISGSYLESQLPAVSIGAAVREVMLVFDAPATYAAAYCTANGYTYQNVINASYEQVINFNALNSYRSDYLYSAMYTLEDPTLGATAQDIINQQNDPVNKYRAAQISGSILFGYLWEPSIEAPQLYEIDPPPANEIENMTIVAMETFGHSADLALEAYINGTISLQDYLAIINALGEQIFGALNNTIIQLDDLWREYYNVSESMYNTYSGMYDNYLQAFSATWTDYLSLFLMIIVVVIVLVIVYKLISKKTGNGGSASAPTVIVNK